MKRLLAVLLALLLLSSCAGMLERDYYVTSAHVEDDAGVVRNFYRVESYAALTAALNAYVGEGMAEGVLRFPTTYESNLTVDLERARRRLLEEEPLGAYALEDLTYHTSRIISYYEVELTFHYRAGIDPAGLSELPVIRDGAALEAVIAGALEELKPGLTVQLAGSREGAEAVQTALELARDSRALLHVDFPEVTATLYPEEGPRAVADLTFRYDYPVRSVEQRRDRTWAAAQSALDGAEPDGDPLAALRARCAFDPDGGSTAYDALLSGRANEEGMARAYQAILQKVGETCRVVREEGCWYVVFPDGSRVSPAWWPEDPGNGGGAGEGGNGP